jgi:hypothetical protein
MRNNEQEWNHFEPNRSVDVISHVRFSLISVNCETKIKKKIKEAHTDKHERQSPNDFLPTMV